LRPSEPACRSTSISRINKLPIIEEAKKLDESSLVEVVEDLEEDAGSDPDAAKKSPD